MRKLIVLMALLFLVQSVSASHYIIGIVNNAASGEDANGKQVVLWNPSIGIEDNLTDIIGIAGASGAKNVYMIDCEMLSSPCGYGDEIRVKVLKEGDYTSYWANLSVKGGGYDVMPNITLNSVPTVALDFPFSYSKSKILIPLVFKLNIGTLQ